MRLSYRFQQFWKALTARPTQDDLVLARTVLTPEQFNLFTRLQPSEQAHSLGIYHALQAEGRREPDLLAAALLHDIGKSCYPLQIWERVLIVAAKTILPEQTERWGYTRSSGWRRPFVVAKQHPAWGAELAQNAGASSLLVEVIRRHQEPLPDHPQSLADLLLVHLKRFDDQG